MTDFNIAKMNENGLRNLLRITEKLADRQVNFASGKECDPVRQQWVTSATEQAKTYCASVNAGGETHSYLAETADQKTLRDGVLKWLDRNKLRKGTKNADEK